VHRALQLPLLLVFNLALPQAVMSWEVKNFEVKIYRHKIRAKSAVVSELAEQEQIFVSVSDHTYDRTNLSQSAQSPIFGDLKAFFALLVGHL
jgi:hypothetical protein